MGSACTKSDVEGSITDDAKICSSEQQLINEEEEYLVDFFYPVYTKSNHQKL